MCVRDRTIENAPRPMMQSTTHCKVINIRARSRMKEHRNNSESRSCQTSCVYILYRARMILKRGECRSLFLISSRLSQVSSCCCLGVHEHETTFRHLDNIFYSLVSHYFISRVGLVAVHKFVKSYHFLQRRVLARRVECSSETF
jgi:hypothetical protein